VPREAEALKDFWHLRTVDWMDQLSPEEVTRLRDASSVREYAANQTVFAPDSQPADLYLLSSGLVRIYRLSAGGAETTFGYVAPGEIFGELAVFGAYRRESYAATTRPSVVWQVPGEFFRDLIANRPEIAIVITRQIGTRFKRIESRVENLVFRDARARLAQILGELGEDFGTTSNGRVLIDIDLTQAELATLVGMTRQTANGLLREFEAERLVHRRGRLLELLDSAGLAVVARGGAVPQARA